MFKSESKANKTDKSRFNKRRAQTSNFRVINSYQGTDKIPNDNLYNNDNYYSINKEFEFPEEEEKSFRLFYHYHFRKNVIKGLLMLLYFRFFFAEINTFYDLFSFRKIFNKKNLIHLISLVFSLIISQDKYLKDNKYNNVIYYTLNFNQSFHIYKIYNVMNTKFEEIIILQAEFLFNCTLFIFLCSKIKEMIIPQIILEAVFFYSINQYKTIKVIFYVAPCSIFVFLIFTILKKSLRERWALYDAFKRSYYNMNQGLLEKDPNPIFILSKEKNILYRNSTASKLINNILDTQQSPKKFGRANKDERFNTMSILEIIHPNFRELFKKILTDVMEDDNLFSFNFPICKSSLQKEENLDICDIYDISNEKIYLNSIWFRINVFKTEWKGKPSFYMCCLPNEDVPLNEIIYKYTKRLAEKMERMISNSDIICDALLNKKGNNNINNNDINESKSSSADFDNKNVGSEEDEPEEENEIEDKKDNLKNKKCAHDLLIEDSSNKELNDVTLFFFKNQVELLYDYSLTCDLYFNFLYKKRNLKYCTESIRTNLKKRIKLKELKSYYNEYFYDFIKEHDYKLEFKEDGENIYNIIIEETYLRVILFNIIIFMICYLDSKDKSPIDNKKEIIIKFFPEIKEETPVTPDSKRKDDENKSTPKISSDSDKNLKKGEITFIFESFSSKADFNKIQELINQKNKSISHIKVEILKLNYLDIGILTVNYLIENYYKTKLEFSNEEGEQSIKFKLPCELELINSSSHSHTFQNNINSESNSFFTSPLFQAKQNITKPKNFYNYNQNYNQKVMNMFYNIKKSPLMQASHKRGIPSFTDINEINTNRAFNRHLSQKNVIVDSKIPNNKFDNDIIDENILENNINNINNNINIEENEKVIKTSEREINKFSFKQLDFYFDTSNGNNNTKNENESKEVINKEDEIKKEESKDKEKESKNKVLIFESQRNKELITLLNNENKGEYYLKILNDVTIAEKEMKIIGSCEYQIVLINMGNIKEIKFAEMICENKGKTLIYGYHFGTHTKCKEKNNAKFDKRFDLSFSSEGIVFTLKHIFINNSSIIK